MKKEIIKTDDYLLLVSDEEIKADEYYVSWSNYYSPPKHVLYVLGIGLNGDNPKKVIAHLPLNGSPELEGIDLLPKIEDEVDKEAKEFADNSASCDYEEGINIGKYQGFVKAKETYKYTEEDLEHIIDIAVQWALRTDGTGETYQEMSKRITQSLQKPKYPIAFECDIEVITESRFKKADSDETIIIEHKAIKTITNSQGKTELVGTYIYEQ